jgi:V/A-type H+/Na+-transporting ATPase subunit E
MNDKLKLLTEKLLNEGIEKGEKEAEKILENAKLEAKKIIESASSRADEILDSAQKDSLERKRKGEAELKLAATKSVALLKNQISDLISLSVSSGSVDKVLSDDKFVQTMILTLLESWAKDGAKAFDAKIYLPKLDKSNLQDFLKNKCKALMDKGMEIEISSDIKTGFKISPKDSSYVVEFSDESFKTFFKEFLKPSIRDLVF